MWFIRSVSLELSDLQLWAISIWLCFHSASPFNIFNSDILVRTLYNSASSFNIFWNCSAPSWSSLYSYASISFLFTDSSHPSFTSRFISTFPTDIRYFTVLCRLSPHSACNSIFASLSSLIKAFLSCVWELFKLLTIGIFKSVKLIQETINQMLKFTRLTWYYFTVTVQQCQSFW